MLDGYSWKNPDDKFVEGWNLDKKFEGRRGSQDLTGCP
jgi:hypothetical protein